MPINLTDLLNKTYTGYTGSQGVGYTGSRGAIGFTGFTGSTGNKNADGGNSFSVYLPSQTVNGGSANG